MRAPLGNLLQEDEAEEINMTPMLDVVFIMLIFFIPSLWDMNIPWTDLDPPKVLLLVGCDGKRVVKESIIFEDCHSSEVGLPLNV